MAFPSSVKKGNDPLFIEPHNPDGFQHVRQPRTKEQSFLFRIDPQSNGRAAILVQSGIRPDWTYAFQNANHFLAAPPNTKEYNPAFTKDQKLRFRLRANPTIKKRTEGKKNGYRLGLLGEEAQTGWLRKRGQQCGFEIIDVNISDEGFARDNSKKANGDRHNMTMLSVRFDGVLRVTDPEAFLHTIAQGIGSAKGMGFGLLSVAPGPSD